MANSWSALNREIVACRQCPRLVEYRERIAREKRRAYRDWDYWGKPVPGFGDPKRAYRFDRTCARRARLESHRAHVHRRCVRRISVPRTSSRRICQSITAQKIGDGLQLRDVFITAICRCAPPDNKPTPPEQANCLPYLARELDLLKRARVVVALGRIAFDGYMRLLRGQGHDIPRLEFKHGAAYNLAKVANPSQGSLPMLICAYHPSKQNTQTGRLTRAMFDAVIRKAGKHADA